MRPSCAAGPYGARGSGPERLPALDRAVRPDGLPDPAFSIFVHNLRRPLTPSGDLRPYRRSGGGRSLVHPVAAHESPCDAGDPCWASADRDQHLGLGREHPRKPGSRRRAMPGSPAHDRHRPNDQQGALRSRCPIFEVRPSRALPPDEFCRGTRADPSCEVAPPSRSSRSAGASAARAMAQTGPHAWDCPSGAGAVLVPAGLRSSVSRSAHRSDRSGPRYGTAARGPISLTARR